MRQRLTITLLLLLSAFAHLQAQENAYGIDDSCYEPYLTADALVGKPGFRDANVKLLEQASLKGDKKAITLYYVLELKDLTRYPSSKENDEAVDRAGETLKDVASKNGYMQYYYYAYQLQQVYYYNNKKINRTLDLVRKMQAEALSNNDAYGLWSADRFLGSLYIEQNDYVSAKPHIVAALNLYNSTTDEAVRRQSPSRLYCDLADTYPIGSDSVRINVEKAFAGAKQHMDTLRYYYYKARLAALDGDRKRYSDYRDFCLKDPAFTRILNRGEHFFSLLDSIFDGTIEQREDEVFNVESIRQVKVIANVCETQGFKDFAFSIEKKLVLQLEQTLARVNQSSLTELDVSMGKAALSANLADKEEEISKMSTLLIITLLILLAATILFSILQIHFLKKNKKKDEARIAELQDANEKVRLADAAKTRFVQNMSHEVRTPLNAIVGFSQLLSLPDGSFAPDEKDEFAGHIINNTKMLTMLLDDILNASAMDSGNYSINYEDGECNFMAQAAISSSEHRLQPGVTMEYIPLPEPFTFRTDPRRVQQILINLLTNACKHTTQGAITLACSLNENPGEVTFSVTDTGPGVPPEQAEAIFDRFTKLNEFVQGTGLGLSICRDIAGRMGGRVFLDTSYPGPGARFVFAVKINSEEN